MAQEVAKAYKKRRTSDELKIATTALHTLQRKLEEQEAIVEKNRTTMNELIKRYRIVDVGTYTRGGGVDANLPDAVFLSRFPISGLE